MAVLHRRSSENVFFPDFTYHETDEEIRLETNVRMLHDGLYYKTKVAEWFRKSDPEHEKLKNTIHMVDRFINIVYLTIFLGKVNQDIVDADGKPIFEMLDDQTDEVTRLNQKMLKG